jgi:hypothetical protein
MWKEAITAKERQGTQGTPRNAKERQGTPRNAKERQGTPRNAKERQDNQLFKAACSSLRPLRAWQ